MSNFVKVMIEYNSRVWAFINLPVLQCVLNLTTETIDNMLDFGVGKAADLRAQLGWESKTGEQSDWSYIMQMAFYVEDFDVANGMIERLKPVQQGLSRPLAFFQARVFFFALNAMRLAKETGKARYRREAAKYTNEMRKWVIKKRCFSVGHKLKVLEAEMMSMNLSRREKRNGSGGDKLMRAYDLAITMSTKTGFLQDAALAAQLGSRCTYLDSETRSDYLRRACDLFTRWGAVGVVSSLAKSHPALTISQEQGGSTQGYRSRERFDKSVTDSHKQQIGTRISLQSARSSQNGKP